MNHGRLLEVGTPSELYQRPQTDFVATFLGSANVLLGECDAAGIHVGDMLFPLKTSADNGRQRVHVIIRPEDLVLTAPDALLNLPTLGIAQIESSVFAGSFERLGLRLPARADLRLIAPPRPFGEISLRLEAQRPSAACQHVPFAIGDQVQVGIQRIHTLTQAGLHILVLTETSTSPIIETGTMLMRQAHGNGTLTLYNTPFEQSMIQALRERLGAGLNNLSLRTSSDGLAETLRREVEHIPYDLLILDASKHLEDELGIALSSGEQHLLLIGRQPVALKHALICVADGEPAKEDIAFAGRFLQELGGSATVLSVTPPPQANSNHYEHTQQFVQACVQSLKLLSVPATGIVRQGHVVDEIEDQLKQETYDLLVIGATLPRHNQEIAVSSSILRLLQQHSDLPILIVRSSYAQPVRHYHKLLTLEEHS